LIDDIISILEKYFDKVDMLHPFKEMSDDPQEESQESYGEGISQNAERDMLMNVSHHRFSLSALLTL